MKGGIFSGRGVMGERGYREDVVGERILINLRVLTKEVGF